MSYMEYNNKKKDTQAKTKKHKNLRENCVSAQKAITFQQKQLAYPDTPFSNAVHFPYYAFVSIGLVINVIIRQGDKMNSQNMQLSSKFKKKKKTRSITTKKPLVEFKPLPTIIYYSQEIGLHLFLLTVREVGRNKIKYR